MKWEVWFSFGVVVEADTEEEAIEKAHKLAVGKDLSDDGYIDTVEELDDDVPVTE